MNIDLYRNGQRIIATDGQMYVDGRWGLNRVRQAVTERNKTYQKNFTHKMADGFLWRGKVINFNKPLTFLLGGFLYLYIN